MQMICGYLKKRSYRSSSYVLIPQISFILTNINQFALEQISPEKWKYDESIELCSDKQPHVSYFREVNDIGSRTVMCRKECLDNELFWEELQLREDPNLWVRILSDFKPTRVNIPLAVKFY